MNKATYKAVLRKKKAIDDYGIIKIRFTRNRKVDYFSLTENLKEKYWLADKGMVRKSYADADRLNKLIEEKIIELKVLHGDANIIEVQADNESRPNQDKSPSFPKFFEGQLKELLVRKRYGSYKSQNSSYTHLKNYLNEREIIDVTFDQITPIFVRSFETYLLNQGLSQNTVIKYLKTIKRIWNEAVGLMVYVPVINPFLLQKNKYAPVIKKDILYKKDVEVIFKTKITEDHPLYHIKNYFLFQIFAQGMRVSDLLTIRWENIGVGGLQYYQFKTKDHHTVAFNDVMVFRLAMYLPDKGDKAFNQKYNATLTGDRFYSMTMQEIDEHYLKLTTEEGAIGKFLTDKDFELELKQWSSFLNKVREKVSAQLQIAFVNYSRIEPKKFIFPILNNEHFKDAVFNENKHRLTPYQYNQMSSKTAVYNKQLKKLQEAVGLNKTITSHLARHTYTNLMIESTNKDIYIISRSLGHKNLKTTESYVSEFSEERVNSGVQGMAGNFRTVI